MCRRPPPPPTPNFVQVMKEEKWTGLREEVMAFGGRLACKATLLPNRFLYQPAGRPHLTLHHGECTPEGRGPRLSVQLCNWGTHAYVYQYMNINIRSLEYIEAHIDMRMHITCTPIHADQHLVHTWYKMLYNSYHYTDIIQTHVGHSDTPPPHTLFVVNLH